MLKTEMIRLRLQGFSYSEIAKRACVSRQRVQQTVAPPKAIRNYIIKKYEGKCAYCGILVGHSGQVHHEGANGDEDYNDIDNLKLLCISCHHLAHGGTGILNLECPACGTSSSRNNRWVWHRNSEGKRIRVMQVKCQNCGRIFIPKTD